MPGDRERLERRVGRERDRERRLGGEGERERAEPAAEGSAVGAEVVEAEEVVEEADILRERERADSARFHVMQNAQVVEAVQAVPASKQYKQVSKQPASKQQAISP